MVLQYTARHNVAVSSGGVSTAMPHSPRRTAAQPVMGHRVLEASLQASVSLPDHDMATQSARLSTSEHARQPVQGLGKRGTTVLFPPSSNATMAVHAQLRLLHQATTTTAVTADAISGTTLTPLSDNTQHAATARRLLRGLHTSGLTPDLSHADTTELHDSMISGKRGKQGGDDEYVDSELVHHMLSCVAQVHDPSAHAPRLLACWEKLRAAVAAQPTAYATALANTLLRDWGLDDTAPGAALPPLDDMQRSTALAALATVEADATQAALVQLLQACASHLRHYYDNDRIQVFATEVLEVLPVLQGQPGDALVEAVADLAGFVTTGAPGQRSHSCTIDTFVEASVRPPCCVGVVHHQLLAQLLRVTR